jgi:D-glycero-alpha-D-manno-heptose 1-phosphate guanylyltransferase
LSEQILDFIKTIYPELRYRYYIEESPLGTGGALAKAISLTSNENIFIVNADTFFEVNLMKMAQEHTLVNADCSISLKEMYGFDRYGSVELDQHNRIVSFKEKSFREKGLINGGYLLLKKEVLLKELKNLPEIFSFEKDFLEVQLTKLLVHGFISNSYFIDIGIPEDYEKAQMEFKKLI